MKTHGLHDGPGLAHSPLPDAPHILVLEDRFDSALALSLLLKRSGYRVTIAETLAEARRVVRRDAFDLAIADLDLPDGSGTDLVPALRRCDRPPPAIALTGYDDPDASRAAGFAEHLTKPIEFADLLSLIARLLGREGR